MRPRGLVGLAAALLAVGAAARASPPLPEGWPPFALGVEYTEKGLAGVYAGTGVTWAKTRLEAFAWGRSEPAPPKDGRHTYDWSCTDALVLEYQSAGLLDLQSYLTPKSSWGSVALDDVMPQARYLPDYEAWVRALVERYDHDGVEDAPGLVAPVRLWVAGGEWTGFWPSGNADDYLVFLAATRRAARAADPNVQVGLIPFLLIDVFEGNEPTSAQIEARLADPPPRFRNSTAGMLKMLGRPDLFDYVNVHSLGDATELPPLIEWLRTQMAARGYARPVFVDDAFPISFLANYHPTPNIGWPAFYPVTEARYQSIYGLLQDVAGLAEPAYSSARAWIEAEVARGVLKKAVTAFGEGYAGIQLGNTEDWMDDTSVSLRRFAVNLIGASAMMGLVDVRHLEPAEVCRPRTPGAARPGWHDLALAAGALSGVTRSEKPAGLPAGIRAYRLLRGSAATTVLWNEPKEAPLPLPGEPDPAVPVDVPVSDATEVSVTTGVTVRGASPETRTLPVVDGAVRLSVDRTPLLVAPAPGRAIENRIVPVILASHGLSGSYFTSELTLTNTGATEAALRARYTAAQGGGSGEATTSLPAGRILVVPDAIEWLRSLGLPIPATGDRVGTLALRFEGLESAESVSVGVRTTTARPEGRAGLAYAAVPRWRASTEPVLLWGLRQDARDRSNVAVLHAGGPSEGPITVRLTVLSGDPDQPTGTRAGDFVLPPGGFTQVPGILWSAGLSLATGAVRVERISGSAPFLAYAVVNDQATSDGSFVPPWPSDLPTSRLVVPAVVETPAYETELVLANGSSAPRTLTLTYAADALTVPSVTITVALRPGEQRFVPDFVDVLRLAGVPGVPPPGPTFAGALVVRPADSQPLAGIFASARTTAEGGGGRYGLFTPAAPEEALARESARLAGLLQDGETRTNLAIVNLDSSEGTFRVDVFDGETGRLAGSRDGIRLGASRWTQLDRVLVGLAPGTRTGWARVVRTAGRGPFLAYAVLNDGGAPGERTGDGAFVEMTPE